VANDLPNDGGSSTTSTSDAARRPSEFAVPGTNRDEYTDGRPLWDWKTKYPPEARSCLTNEAWILAALLLLSLLVSAWFVGLGTQSLKIPLHWFVFEGGASGPLTLDIEFRLLMIFFVGCLGGATFSIKWLVHSAAKGKWHLDRRYWRLFVPVLGGVYACVILALLETGFISGSQALDKPRPVMTTAAFAFLVGYFSDGVSGLLSNIANAVFGTLEKK
jgi:hypothetical protein